MTVTVGHVPRHQFFFMLVYSRDSCAVSTRASSFSNSRMAIYHASRLWEKHWFVVVKKLYSGIELFFLQFNNNEVSRYGFEWWGLFEVFKGNVRRKKQKCFSLRTVCSEHINNNG